MEVRASLRYLRMSLKKVRLVADMVRGMEAENALIQLRFSRKSASHPLEKLLRSAMANAKNNLKIEGKELYITHITVDQGPTLKRWRARAMGRAATIRKRTSHISIILEEKEGAAKTEDKKKVAPKQQGEKKSKKMPDATTKKVHTKTTTQDKAEILPSTI